MCLGYLIVVRVPGQSSQTSLLVHEYIQYSDDHLSSIFYLDTLYTGIQTCVTDCPIFITNFRIPATGDITLMFDSVRMLPSIPQNMTVQTLWVPGIQTYSTPSSRVQTYGPSSIRCRHIQHLLLRFPMWELGFLAISFGAFFNVGIIMPNEDKVRTCWLRSADI